MDDRLRPPDGEVPYQFVTNTTSSASSAYAPELLTCYQTLEFLWGWMSNVVLLNLLIAMMSNRQARSQVSERVERSHTRRLVRDPAPLYLTCLPKGT